MFLLTPYQDTSRKEDETNPQSSEEQGDVLFHLKCHLFPQRSWELHLTVGFNLNWILTYSLHRACRPKLSSQLEPGLENGNV